MLNSHNVKHSLERVLCPVDISHADAAKPQLQLCWNLAHRAGAELDCLFVNPFYDLHAGYGPFLEGAAYNDVVQSVTPEELIREDKKQLRRLCEEVGIPIADPSVSMECQVGPVYNSVRDWMGGPLSSQAAAFIAVTKAASGNFMDFVLGSLATRIIRTSQMPCLVLPENRYDANWKPEHVVMGFALDCPTITEHPFVEVLPQLGCESLTLVHAFKRQLVLQASGAYRAVRGGDGHDDVLYALIEDNIRHRLEAAVEALPPVFKERDLRFEVGKPEVILQQACEAYPPEKTLMVLGRNSPATELGYLGSTLQHLVNASRVPVLILPTGMD